MPALIPYRLLLAVVVLGALALGLDRLIVTDKEAIQAVVEEATIATREGDFRALGAALDTEYAGKGGSRDGAIRLVEGLWKTWRPMDLSTELGEIVVDGGSAKAPMVVKGNVLGRPLVLDLETTYVERDDGWKVAGAQVTGLGELIRIR